MQVKASLKNLRVSPRKARLAAGLIKGLDVDDAFSQLESSIKKTCPPLVKLLNSAISNGENNLGIDRGNMFVQDVRVNAGPVFKRWMPKAFGRAGRITKRTSKIDLIIAERIEGKNRKTQEQLAKERKAKAQEKVRLEKEREKEREKESQKASSAAPKVKMETDKTKEGDTAKKSGKGWANRIFRRKSM